MLETGQFFSEMFLLFRLSLFPMQCTEIGYCGEDARACRRPHSPKEPHRGQDRRQTHLWLCLGPCRCALCSLTVVCLSIWGQRFFKFGDPGVRAEFPPGWIEIEWVPRQRQDSCQNFFDLKIPPPKVGPSLGACPGVLGWFCPPPLPGP